MAEPRVAIVTDTHFGVRKGSQVFHDYFEKFYSEVFFPKLDEEGIDTVIHLGDCFDVRKGIDYWSLNWAKRVFFKPLQERGISLHLIVGNHDIFYKQSLSLNSPQLNLTEFENVTVYSKPGTHVIKEVPIYFIPWVCEENSQEFVDSLSKTNASLAWGHLELAGFYANKDYQCPHGMDASILQKFDKVLSGHFHKKNSSGNVHYLGNTYQMYWNDEGETRGFHIMNLNTLDMEYIENPHSMFAKIYYDESKKRLYNPHKYSNKYLKLIVDGKSTPSKLNNFIDSLYEVGIHDLKVIDNIDTSIDEDINFESEDTLTTLTKYVTHMEEEGFNKDNIVNIFRSLYVEAQEV